MRDEKNKRKINSRFSGSYVLVLIICDSFFRVCRLL